MKQSTAPATLAINLVTGFVFVLNAGLYIGAIYFRPLLAGGMIVSLSILACYFFWAPVEYELAGDELVVSFRVGRVRYRPVVRCSVIDGPVRCAVRLCGNGGLFAGSGIFWNRQFGVFRAFVTTNKPGTLVLVETPKTKILISPADPQGWLASA